MSKIDDFICDLEEQEMGVIKKRVLIVEGDDDITAFESFLAKHNGDWEESWLIAPAGKKTNVIKVLQKRPNWIGVVDADEWLPEMIAQKQREVSNLWVLPRFCIESYLAVAAELWQAIPESMQSKIPDGLDEVNRRINENLEQWVKHGVLWWVINPLQDGIQRLGFKDALLNFRVAQDEEVIRVKLKEWYDFIEPDALLQKYHAKLTEIAALPREQQIRHWIHGKLFFQQVVNKVLNDLLDMRIAGEDYRAAKKMKALLFNHCPVPADFNPLWQKMGLEAA